MIGYGVGDTTIGIAYKPQRKKPCLVIRKGNSITKVATFNDEYSATIFLDELADFLHIHRFDWINDESLPVGYRKARGWKLEDEEVNE